DRLSEIDVVIDRRVGGHHHVVRDEDEHIAGEPRGELPLVAGYGEDRAGAAPHLEAIAPPPSHRRHHAADRGLGWRTPVLREDAEDRAHGASTSSTSASSAKEPTRPASSPSTRDPCSTQAWAANRPSCRRTPMRIRLP